MPGPTAGSKYASRMSSFSTPYTTSSPSTYTLGGRNLNATIDDGGGRGNIARFKDGGGFNMGGMVGTGFSIGGTGIGQLIN